MPRCLVASSRSRICACTVTSSAVVGSSAISSRGSSAIAEAIRARWRRPPESSCGSWRARSSGSGTPTSRSRSITFASRLARSPQPCTRSGSAISLPTLRSGSSETSASWSTKPTSAPRMLRQWRSLSPTQRLPVQLQPAGLDVRSPAGQPDQGAGGDALARAGLADDRQAPARLDREGDAAHHGVDLVARPKPTERFSTCSNGVLIGLLLQSVVGGNGRGR